MEVLEFIRQFPMKSFTKGETILSEGHPLSSIYAVRTGFIKVTSLSESGNERLLWIAGPGNMVPAEQLFAVSGSLRFFYTALSDCEVYKVDKLQFVEYTKNTPILMAEIARRMSSHYDDLLMRVDTVGQVNVRDKLIYALCHLARRFSDDDIVNMHQLGLVLTHQDMSEMVGSTRETTSLELRKLMLLGGITYDRNQFIINVPELEAMRSR
ncbi:Crp/Fnr family transcriptional regulator [Candidatus Saccharibacteria bacterium]|nr:Crp/Fnr family transcriptional regulator [Candidatus Saccharibacteria bacterium]